jgi:hypothetical protein
MVKRVRLVRIAQAILAINLPLQLGYILIGGAKLRWERGNQPRK